MKIRNVVVLASALILSFSTIAFADEVDDRVESTSAQIERYTVRGCLSSNQGKRYSSKLNNIKSFAEMRRSRNLSVKPAQRQIDELVDRINGIINDPNNICNQIK